MAKKCFIITPLGEPDSIVRRSSNGLIDSVIEPILNELSISIEVSDRISKEGSITNQIIEHLLNDELVIANLTGLNPNVMYELSIRHCSAKPVILLAERETKIPFDVSNERAIFFINDMQGVKDLKEKLRQAVKLSIKNTEPTDNPVYRVVKDIAIRKAVESKPQDYIVNLLQEINNKISNNLTTNRMVLASENFNGISIGDTSPNVINVSNLPSFKFNDQSSGLKVVDSLTFANPVKRK